MERAIDPAGSTPPDQLALQARIAELAAQGREEEREAAAWQLADLIMARTLPHG